MKWRYLLYIMMAGMGAAACSEELPMPSTEKASEATVHINLQQDGPVIDAATRSTTPMPLEDANKIYHLWLLQYNQEGSLVTTVEKNDINAAGVLNLSWSPTLEAGKSTICLIANLDTANKPESWPAFLPDLRNAVLPLPIEEAGKYNGRMYMFGYYEGEIKDGSVLNILMGRMAACINLVITSEVPKLYIDKVEIKNLVTNAHYFPMTGETGGILTYGNFSDQNVTFPTSDEPLLLYYYTGESINPAESNRTSITITAGGKTYNLDLGSASPGTTNRDYSLYRNNHYTFNINLKN